ncbi:tRNA-specific adenosine deaminase 1 [Selaginella moellendorffii]|uniref:tRNA-specific adenosine deaminase 1 n=1 Tax=Selaginella moellendorffii TaxID=88036 RepID=UPI000D1C34DC|nr:tRNA-specific adenosine deaminase 1 [Selaginella moellendorffii]|eukprot:XP_024520009.1 tRNA-specific adenosine deaminase 1 [Selaginella moellendorffii]
MIMANCAPCGDACILGVDPGAGEDDHSVFCCTTGAKLVSTQVHSEQSLQTTGMLRRKPGRGDATFSMSCSDKIEFKELSCPCSSTNQYTSRRLLLLGARKHRVLGGTEARSSLQTQPASDLAGTNTSGGLHALSKWIACGYSISWDTSGPTRL